MLGYTSIILNNIFFILFVKKTYFLHEYFGFTPNLAHAFFNGEPGLKSTFLPLAVKTVIWRLLLLLFPLLQLLDTVKALVVEYAMITIRRMDSIDFGIMFIFCWCIGSYLGMRWLDVTKIRRVIVMMMIIISSYRQLTWMCCSLELFFQVCVIKNKKLTHKAS